MYDKMLLFNDGSSISVRSVLDHQYEDKTVSFSFDEFLNADDTLLGPGWHQLTQNMLVVVSNYFCSGRWRKIYQVLCEGVLTHQEHTVLIKSMYGW